MQVLSISKKNLKNKKEREFIMNTIEIDCLIYREPFQDVIVLEKVSFIRISERKIQFYYTDGVSIVYLKESALNTNREPSVTKEQFEQIKTKIEIYKNRNNVL